MPYNEFEVSAVEDYKEKFELLFKETTKAIHILTEVQRECTEAYISAVLEDEQNKARTQE